MKKWLFLLLFVCTQSLAQTIDTIVVAQYNLLNYGNVTAQCTGTNNGVVAKEGWLKTVFAAINPDIFIANEVGSGPIYGTRLLNNCMNVDGITKYQQVTTSNQVNSSIINAVFINAEKFGFISHWPVFRSVNNSNLTRDIDVITLYYKEPELANGADTTYLRIVAAHLKAGNTAADETERTRMAEALMKYFDDRNIRGNIIMAGDFNIQNSNVGAYQQLMKNANTEISLVDPLNPLAVPQIWNENPTYAYMHTQSTRTTDTKGGCMSGGGMDDRFDFIIMSKAIQNGTDFMRLVPQSYKALGQDGNRFNQSLINGSNTSVNPTTLNALYEMSDHLPVIAKFAIQQKQSTVSVEENSPSKSIEKIYFSTAHQLQIELSLANTKVFVTIADIMGKILHSAPYASSERIISITTNDFISGIYLINLNFEGGESHWIKVIKN